ncbi:unnamed protein product [Rhodiola kirilowii]
MKKQIFCWNARGIVNKATCDYLSLMIRNHNLGICCILEPKADPEELAILARKMGFQSYLNCHPINSHIWIMWTEDFKITTLAYSDQHISVEVNNEVEDIKMVCSFVYAFIDINLRQQLWEDIGELSLQIDSPWLLMGDFNSIASWNEKKGGNKKNGKSIRQFNDFMAKVGISDAGYEGSPFTWSNNQEGASRIWERLDRCLINGLAMNFFPGLRIKHLTRAASDHCPLLLSFDDDKKKGKRSFKFMGMWTQHPDFLNKVQHSWEGQMHENPLVNFGLKLKRTRAALNSWNWEVFGDVNRKIKETQVLLDSLECQLQNAWSDNISSHITEARQTLNNLLRFQLGMLEEKAKVSWYSDGDRNSSFFHASIKARRAQNTIKLKLEDGSITEDGDVIGLRAAHYFKDLFGDFSASGDIQVTDLVQKVISEEDNVSLSATPSLEEIQHNVFSMNSNSSPGPDGFTGKFFTFCWEIIKEDLQAAVQAFFEGLQLPKIISSTSIVLIPKVHNAGKLDQVRPISLCNFIHKILSRILNSRLTNILKRVISQEQSGFLEGRNIHDCIGMAHDMVRDINIKSFGGNIMMKIDMSKAYDRISWRFILKMMAAMGFSEKWIDLIYRNISNCWYSVLWNGTSYGFFKSNKGVRQGDPLSPSLFILGMEYLSRLINEAIRKGKLVAYKTKGCRTTFHHLMYADDLLIFSNGHTRSVNNLMKIINRFCELSGQQINSDKSRVFFSKLIGIERIKTILQNTKFSEGSFPTRYLGAPLYPGRTRVSYFKYLEDSIRSKITGWAKNFLNISGRATLISSVLSSLSIHTLSIIPVPKTCIDCMERLFANFIWDGKHHWVSWDNICLPKNEGGLGIRNLKGVKDAMLGKVAWRFLLNESCWARFSRIKFLNNSRKPGIWTSVMPLVESLKRESYWTIGRGDISITHFCEWLDCSPPKAAKLWTVRDIINDEVKGNKFASWFPAISRDVLRNIQLNDYPDMLSWRVTPGGIFTTKAYYNYKRRNMPKSKLFDNLWQNWIPPKLSGLVWKLWHRGLPTDEAISNLGIPITSKCRCCLQHNMESSNHLFLHSDVAKSTWKFLGLIFGKRPPSSMLRLKRDWFIDINLKDFIDCLALTLACCAIWEIWNYRNCIMFDKETPNIQRNLICWASRCANLIKKGYKRTLSSKISLELLHVREPDLPVKGSWLHWFPGEEGLSLSVAFNNHRGAGIIRDSKGTFKLAVAMQFDDDEIFSVIGNLMENVCNQGLAIKYIFCSHKEFHLMQANCFSGPWKFFQCWRKAREKIKNCNLEQIMPSLNQPAIALSYADNPDPFVQYNSVNDLPITVKHGLVGDYLKLPLWCRKEGMFEDNQCLCFDMHKCLLCAAATSVHCHQKNHAGIIFME